MRVLVGVTGGIAAYKAALVVRALKEDGHDVWVVPTPASLSFVGRATWEALSGHPAPSDTFADVPAVTHVRLGQRADAILVVPATADFLASYAHGEAPNLLGNALLATTAPVVLAPAMHTEMWQHPATVANVAELRERGVTVIDPAVGRLTGPDSGPGRLPDPEDIVAGFYSAVGVEASADASAGSGTSVAAAPGHGWGDLEGLRVVVSAGGTREPIDPVRYLGNRSSGMQGFAIAEAARERGAQVTVVAANVALPLSEGVERVNVETTAQLREAMLEARQGADIVVMAAAVADFTPADVSGTKIKKAGGGLTLALVQTPDILAELVHTRPAEQTLVGFAAETGDDSQSARDHAADKARRKGADLLVFNDVGGGGVFGDADNAVTILAADGSQVSEAEGTKLAVAHAVLDAVVSVRE